MSEKAAKKVKYIKSMVENFTLINNEDDSEYGILSHFN